MIERREANGVASVSPSPSPVRSFGCMQDGQQTLGLPSPLSSFEPACSFAQLLSPLPISRVRVLTVGGANEAGEERHSCPFQAAELIRAQGECPPPYPFQAAVVVVVVHSAVRPKP